ncbi:MAG TPA: hypothetical protein VIK86_07815 [Candidatus Paceibacterota bacterium]
MSKELNLQNWAMANIPKKEMYYEKAFWDNIIFWRDTILPLFYNNQEEDYEKYYDFVNEHHSVIGEHTSKSITNPVIFMNYKGCKMVFRENFYGYEMAIINDKDLILIQDGLFLSRDDSFYYQGFPDYYKIKSRYEDNKKYFILSITNDYKFYTFMFLLKNEIDRVNL